ncbi:MAG TPA: c-type cytochrome domain-containing protein [Verrucomicrobiae bacterium]|nr:c-type cytochrome domain-containing protein [Verrucomicrobiae bacterium]
MASLAISVVFLTTTTQAAEVPPDAGAVSFSKDIAPILQQKCVTCHGPDKSKGHFQLHTFEAMNKPGESKEAPLISGQAQASKIYRLLIAKDPDDRMPQKDDPLPAPQIALIERWITEGARFDGADPKSALASLTTDVKHPEPPEVYSRPVPIAALAFQPDGQLLAAGGYHEVTLWNPTNGTLVQRLKNMEQQTSALAYSPDGQWLATAGGTPGRSGETKLVDVRNGFVARLVARTSDVLLALAFSPDGQTLAVGGADNVIRILAVPSGQEERRIEQHADWVTSLAYSPDATKLASASRDKTARLFDPGTGELEETYTGHTQPLFGVGFASGGTVLVSGGRDKTLHVWQAKEAKKSFEISGFDLGVWRLLMHSNDVFTASTDRLVRQHRLGAKQAELIRTFQGHRDVVYALAYHVSSQRLASAGYDGEVRIWNMADGRLLTEFIAAPGR